MMVTFDKILEGLKMKKKTWISILAIGPMVFLMTPVSDAKDYSIEEYRFVWEAAKVGGITMRIEKSQDGLGVILGSTGGSLATVEFTSSQATAVGDVLAKAEEYYNKYKESKNRENFDTIPVDGAFVTFKSKSGTRTMDFDARVHTSKYVGAAVVMTKEQAMEVAGYLKDAENMAAYVDKIIKP
jgi:hypothetical protein